LTVAAFKLYNRYQVLQFNQKEEIGEGVMKKTILVVVIAFCLLSVV